MATENIVSKVYRVLTDVSSRVWDKISFWCLAKDVELANGKNLETTCGSITGITSSLTSTSKTMAASASAVKQLNDKITELNSNLNNIVDEVTNEKIVFSGIKLSDNAQIHMGNNPSRLYMNTDYFDINPNNGNQLICKKAGTYNIFVASLGVTNTDWSQVLLINGSIKNSNATYDLSANDTLEMYNNYYSSNSMMACFITLA